MNTCNYVVLFYKRYTFTPFTLTCSLELVYYPFFQSQIPTFLGTSSWNVGLAASSALYLGLLSFCLLWWDKPILQPLLKFSTATYTICIIIQCKHNHWLWLMCAPVLKFSLLGDGREGWGPLHHLKICLSPPFSPSKSAFLTTK